ncbi:MAG TPA: M23 family metallopeptidase [Roseiarcus sp.]|nr:M23 family metallopeptidase [Roseiarcus sp.]
MTRRGGTLALAASLAVFCLCAGLVGWRLMAHRPATGPEPTKVSGAPAPAAGKAPPAAKLSTIIDLPGDPVLVRRGAVSAPKELRLAVPSKLAANAPKLEAQAYYVSAALVSTDGGYMGKFPEAGQEADALAERLAMNSAQMAGAGDAAQMEAGADDDGGADTPDDAQDLTLTSANSNQLEVVAGGADGRPQLKQTILKTVVAEKIGDLLIANGFAADGARALEAAAKAAFNVQTLPAQSVALAVGALDAAGDYRATQLAIYENNDYVGAIALAESGLYGEGARPTIPQGLLDDSGRTADAAVHFDLADGIYSAGLRNGMPEPVIREAIQLIGRLADLKSPLLADEALRAIFARDYRDKSKSSGKIVYVGLRGGGAGAVDCYSFEAADGAFRCFDAKGALEPKAGAPPQSLGDSGAVSVGGILAPIKGAPVTSLFGMRFHPILHILRLHAGIDFGAAVGSQVRASADGKVEIAGPVSGFGNHIRVQHKGFETSYSHLSEIPAAIKPGVDVTQGEIIALSGNTGLSTGPHLHFEFYLNGVAVDPMPHMGTEVQAAAATLASGAAVAASPAAATAASPAEIAAFPAAKALVDAALEEAAK